jgi:hypothetical protein
MPTQSNPSIYNSAKIIFAYFFAISMPKKVERIGVQTAGCKAWVPYNLTPWDSLSIEGTTLES